ncbi:hypothetical protein CAP35_03655 [Chitinophagaceae bacterium IBVUCB1]|nr:hypothetical protein CAP35_03655 [Chitinophagaceae bacterium IBVUCB1]
MYVSVITAMPNYPAMQIKKGYEGKWYIKEEIDRIPVHRSWIFVRKSNSILLRLLNYFSFVFSAMWVGLFKVKKHDIVICESPPLFLGITALALKLFRGSKIVFNVSDLWPESAEKLGLVSNKIFLKAAYWLEALIYKRAVLVSGQTQGIVKSINTRFPKVNTHWLPNGIDTDKHNTTNVSYDWRIANGYSTADFIVMYAGILGHAQALEVILKAAAILKNESSLKFVLIGDGPQKEYLHKVKQESDITNVAFFPNQPQHEMPNIIHAIDAAVVPLKNIPLFKGAIPSKIFENLAFGKPILLGVDGEAKELFIDEGKCGLFFTPENEQELADSILKLYCDKQLYAAFGKNGKQYVNEKFDRQKIAEVFYKKLQYL